MTRDVEYGTPFHFPDAQIDGMDIHELRRYVKDLSFFRTEHFVKKGVFIDEADCVFPFNRYHMQPDEHHLFTNTTTAGFWYVDLPDPQYADAAIYTIRRGRAFGYWTVGSQGSALVQAVPSIALNTSIVASPWFTISFVHDGAHWWRIT